MEIILGNNFFRSMPDVEPPNVGLFPMHKHLLTAAVFVGGTLAGIALAAYLAQKNAPVAQPAS